MEHPGLSELTKDQLELVQQLKVEVAQIVQADAALQHFCKEWTYVRYLRARHWHIAKAKKMLIATLEWRKEVKPHDITWNHVADEGKTGKVFIMPSVDKHGLPVILMRPRFENSKNHEQQVRWLIYNLELASRQADELGVGKMTWLIDFVGYTMKNAVPLNTSMKILHILQNHYPERLGCAVCYLAPTLFSFTFKAVKPFIDPVTAKKLVFVDSVPKHSYLMQERFDMESMEECVGGKIKGYLFQVDSYGQRLSAIDSQVAKEIQDLAGKHSQTSPGLPIQASVKSG